MIFVRFKAYRLSRPERGGCPVFTAHTGSLFIPRDSFEDSLQYISERLTERVPGAIIREFWLKGGEFDG